MESIYEAILNQLFESPLLFCSVLTVVLALGWQHFSCEIKEIRKTLKEKADSREIKEIRKTLKEKADCKTVRGLENCVYGWDNNGGIRREVNEAKELCKNIVWQLGQRDSRIENLEGNLNQVRCPNTCKNAMNGEYDDDDDRRSSILTYERDNYN